MDTPKNRLFWLVFFGLIGFHIFLICVLRIYPFVDLPMHLASATIYRYFGEANNVFNQFYTIEKIFGQPNTFHLLFCGLKIFPSVEFANKLFYCLYVILLPISTLLVIKKVDGNPWFSVLSFLVLYNLNVSWGFVGFMISIPFVLLFIASLFDYLFKHRIRDSIIITFLFLLLFLMHVLTSIFCVMIFITSVIVFNKNSFLRILKKSIILIPIILLIILWQSSQPSQVHGQSMLSILLDYYRNAYFQTFSLRTGLFYWDNYLLTGGLLGCVIASLFSLVIIAVSLNWRDPLKNPFGQKAKTKRFIFISILFINSILWYLLFPRIRGIFQVSFYRFTVFCFLSIIILGSIVAHRSIPQIKIQLICAVSFLHFILWANYFGDFYKENREFTGKIFPETSKEKILAGVMYDFRYKGQPVYIHFPNYFIVWKKGIATTRVIDFGGPWSIGRKVGKNILPEYNEWVGLYNDYDGRYVDVDFIYARGKFPKKDLQYFKKFEIVGQLDEWTFCRRKTESENDE